MHRQASDLLTLPALLFVIAALYLLLGAIAGVP